MALRLSILIATMPKRAEQFSVLLESLIPQLTDEVEVLTNIRMDINIGTKRNILLKEAQGDYTVFIDDDDTVSSQYVKLILEALKGEPDCVGISGIISTDRAHTQQWHISKDYGSWYEKDTVYYRTPNHISPVRREIALQVGFPEIAHGEDYQYSIGILPLLKTENKIKGNIYHYQFASQ